MRREFAKLMLAELHFHDRSRLITVFMLVFLAASDVTLAAELPVVIGVAATATGSESERFRHTRGVTSERKHKMNRVLLCAISSYPCHVGEEADRRVCW